MTMALGGTMAILAFVLGLAIGDKSRRSTARPEPLSDADAQQARTVMNARGEAFGVKEIRRLRPDLSIRDARHAAAAL